MVLNDLVESATEVPLLQVFFLDDDADRSVEVVETQNPDLSEIITWVRLGGSVFITSKGAGRIEEVDVTTGMTASEDWVESLQRVTSSLEEPNKGEMAGMEAQRLLQTRVRGLRIERGRRVNLHLKDGSVIINVQLIDVTTLGSEHVLRYRTPFGRGEVRLSAVAWMEGLNPLLVPNVVEGR